MDIEREEDEVELVEKMDGRSAGRGSDGWPWTRNGDGDGTAKRKAGAARSEGQAAQQRHGMGVAGKGARGSQSMTTWLLGKGVSLGVGRKFLVSLPRSMAVSNGPIRRRQAA
jgi:hypothetical protein